MIAGNSELMRFYSVPNQKNYTLIYTNFNISIPNIFVILQKKTKHQHRYSEELKILAHDTIFLHNFQFQEFDLQGGEHDCIVDEEACCRYFC